MNPLSDQTPNQSAANAPTATVQNTPAPNASATPASTPTSSTPGAPVQQQPTQPQPNIAQPPQNGNQSDVVSNTPAPVHPSVQRAGVIRQIAQTLAGGTRYSTTIDPATGAATRTPIPMSKSDIGMAIALEAISGALSGLAQSGPGATGRAAEAGFQQVSAHQQQAQQAQEEAAQQQYKDSTQALVRNANAFEVNSRTILNTAQAERYGVESLKDGVSQNAQLLSDYQDAGAVQESHVSQDDLNAGIKNGTYHAATQIAVPDGFTNINGRYEQTFSIVANPAAKVPLTSEQAKAYADAGVPGFAAFKTGNVPNGVLVPGYMVANANQRVQAINLMKSDFSNVSDTLSSSSDKDNQELAKSIPNIQSLLDDKSSGPVLNVALGKFQKYVSHSDMHGMDLYESLRQMAAPSKLDPRNPKQFVPNPDTGAAQTIAGAFGGGDPKKGWAILRAYHNEITPVPVKSEAEAESVLADPSSSSKAKVQAHSFLHLASQQKQADATGRNVRDGEGALNLAALTPKEYQAIIDGIGTNTLDASQMLRYGRADQIKILADVKAKYPNFSQIQFQNNLALAKWATSGKGGDQIQALNTLHAHADDFLGNINQLANIRPSLLNTPINKLKTWSGDPNVPATVARMLALRTEYMNALNNNHALTKEDKEDAQQLLNLNQSPAQWQSVVQQIQHTADLRGSQTNARYRATFGKDMPNYRPPQSQTPGANQLFQYMTADGKLGWNGSKWVATGK